MFKQTLIKSQRVRAREDISSDKLVMTVLHSKEYAAARDLLSKGPAKTHGAKDNYNGGNVDLRHKYYSSDDFQCGAPVILLTPIPVSKI